MKKRVQDSKEKKGLAPVEDSEGYDLIFMWEPVSEKIWFKVLKEI